jgi:hypothetical protein
LLRARTGGGYQGSLSRSDKRLRSKTYRRKVGRQSLAQSTEADKARGDWLDPRLARVTFGQYVEEWRPTIANLKPT